MNILFTSSLLNLGSHRVPYDSVRVTKYCFVGCNHGAWSMRRRDTKCTF